ncbi:hypothetical protein RNI52_22165 [Labrys neptuniae]|uniref:hypothetical protein n=1 Tax=Labrys neptuniae TaxID=376174 RepID=UPI0028916217|nr:hypothetical protein [Labrys neptuniae]MDT3380047.1 hypothetical protein [Labrys neptuniae]
MHVTAKREEEEAGEREQELVDALAMTPAASLAGIAGKLDMILYESTVWIDDIEFPQPQIRSALRDLVRIAKAIEPDVFIPGDDRQGGPLTQTS